MVFSGVWWCAIKRHFAFLYPIPPNVIFAASNDIVWHNQLQINNKMDLQEIMESGANVTLAVSTKDLRDYSTNLLNDFLKQFKPKPEETYLTVEDVCRRLSVDASTLWRWNKIGYLPKVKVGAKVRYRESDIKKIMEA